MRNLFATAAILSLTTGTALAADPPVGDWMVKDGYGIVRIDNCNGKMWGIIIWEKVAGFDAENPDPAKKGRPKLGVPILIGMAPTNPNKWEGEIYNTENGKTYSGNISMLDENALQLEGCLFPNFLCGGQKWTRVTQLPSEGVSLHTAPVKQSKAPAKKGAATATSEVCTRVADETSGSSAKGSARK